eukprot:gnl/MRDRNA2_/MRDRNA2_135878_c0_seq1.p1 gnl/MRDRNA2_/MRDRNA2_135878_c0~~gnl/MRDRNA2_/MRDRNA2_135878_c0_seq1.p1  ORF type:complete len:999 (-),score=217.44 gnl/MRDRNA2_/MRDRNA2_135878_c0_seq1:58-3054(-)
MGVRRTLLRYLLAQTKYIRNLSEQQIRASLWRGEATFYKIELEPRLIQELLIDIWPLSLEVVEVHIDELTVKIPWSQLMTQSTLIVAKTIEIRCEIRCEDEKEWREIVGPMIRRVVTMTRETVNRAPISLSSTFSSATSALDQLTVRMVDGLQIQVGHIKLSFWSRHWRHFPNGLEFPERNMKEESEETLVAFADDVLLSPCDQGKVPSDKMRSMAVYDHDVRELECTKLLKIGALRVSPPSKSSKQQGEGQGDPGSPASGTSSVLSLAEEFMDAPTVLTCFIVVRSPCDGCRLCPFPIKTECLIDLPNPLNITLSEHQLQALFAIVGDIGQMESWRLDDSLLKIGESEDKSPMMAGTECHLIDTSNVSRTIARGTVPRPKSKEKRRGSDSSKRSPPGLAGGIWQKVWRQPEDKKSGSHLAPGFHPVDLADIKPDMQELTRTTSADSGPASIGSGVDEKCNEAPEASGKPDEDLQNEAEEVYEEEDIGDDEDLEDFVSVASDEDEEWAAKPALSGWEKMKNWFGSRAAHSDACKVWPEMSTFHSILQIAVASLSVQVDVRGASVDLDIDRLIWRTETWCNFTNFQLDCIRRLKASAESRGDSDIPGPMFGGPLTLPTFTDGWAHMTWHRGSLWYGQPGEEVSLVQSLESTGTGRDLLTLTMRPRDAPCEVLPEMECPGQRVLRNWPMDIMVCHANIAIEAPVLEKLIQAWQRLLPFMLPKIPPNPLISPSILDIHEGVKVESSLNQKPADGHLEEFPGEFMRIELIDCEAFEPDEAAAITNEERWPFRVSAPRIVIRSNSDRWDFSQTVLESPPTPAVGSTASPATQYATPLCLSPRNSGREGLPRDMDGMVTIPTEMFDQLVARAAEATQKEAQVMAAREELQRAYISLAAANAKDKHGAPHGSSSADAAQMKPNDLPMSSDADYGKENERLRRRNTQLESSLQAATLAQRRLEAELAHHQAHAQDSLSKFLLKAAKAKAKADAVSAHDAMVRRAFG